MLFQLSEYATLPRRLIASLIDLGLLLFVFFLASSMVTVARVPKEVLRMSDKVERTKQMRQYLGHSMTPITVGWLLCIPAYHILLRRTRGGTLGYRIARIRIVDTYGLPPVVPVLIKRFLLAFFLVPFFGISYFGVPKHPRHQAAHDELAGTWLVLTNALPSAPAKVAYQTKFLGTMPITYADLEPLDASETAESDAS